MTRDAGNKAARPFHEFFAGSGLVSVGLAPAFKASWANDVSKRKARVYRANLDGEALHLGDVSEVDGASLPDAVLSWASFPCQDLSLAGNIGGIHSARSGLVWQWLRILDELGERAPKVICLENVIGLVSSKGGNDYRLLHAALVNRGYRVGAVVINADRFVPQSRPRVFVMGTKGKVPEHLISDGPTWAHSPALARLGETIEGFTWWNLPEPEARTTEIDDVIEQVEYDKDNVTALVPQRHVEKFRLSGRKFATGYRRTRNGKQVLELRCDGIAGCLRTPAGGSSRQYIVQREGKRLHARLLTAREAARLMGAPDDFELPGTYNDAYFAMGDAVVAPVVHFLSENALRELVDYAYVA
ncbi:DNA cytosine methyltransferase [Olsenella sp. SW781]|uniref:DNA cytosine methyltransferase n=1 Tax=Olsenella sp. SW781 TaxID=2530046 RepID=UPI00143B23FE|nr:DNA cytosine methyltransferase [Olsenella sp. SW781]